MSTNDAIELELEVFLEGSTKKELDTITRHLLKELEKTNVESVNLVSGIAPDGTKGDAITIGTLAIEVLPSAIPAVIALVQAWMLRDKNRTVKFKNKDFEFEGSPQELEKILEKFSKGKKKK